MAGIRERDKRAAMLNQLVMEHCTLFVLSSQYVLFLGQGTGLFRPLVA
jgi:hypothetical protein